MDTIAEFLNVVRNARKAGHDKVDIAASGMRKGMAEILKKKGYIKDYRVADDGKQGLMRVYLADTRVYRGEFKRISKPGRRIYVGWRDLKPVRSGHGFAILSTPKGLLTDEEARQLKVGGELLCLLW